MTEKNIKPIQTAYNGYRFRGKRLPASPKKHMSKRVDITNKRFGRCVAIECLGVTKGGYRLWGCVCDCGTKFAARSRELLRGHTKSCGCLQQETRQKGGWNKLPFGHAARNELLASYKKSARERGIEWEIDDEDFFNIIASSCIYCGSPPKNERKPNKNVNGGFMYSGIDRLNSSIGYVSGNIAAACWDCNRAKGSLSVKEFCDWLDTVLNYKTIRQANLDQLAIE